MKFRIIAFTGENKVYLQYKWGFFWLYVKRAVGHWDGIDYVRASFEDVLDAKKAAVRFANAQASEKARKKKEVLEEFVV